MATLEERTIAKVSRRLLPLLIVCYFGAFLDRVNVSFAALTMNRDLGLTASEYGFGAGLFFITYFAFEVPSNLWLARVGARRWIARIMLTWGLISASTALVTNAQGFYAVRLLLGAAEAGFFPGIILYLTRWFPGPYRARIIGGFMAAGPLSTVIGGPGSALLLALDGTLGLHGWQWLFIIEAVPSVVLSFVVLRRLTERPEEATWLTGEEREWLVTRMAQEARDRSRDGAPSLAAVLLDSRVVMLCVAYFALIGSNNGLGLFLPQIVQSFGLTPAKASLLAALPFVVGVFGTVFWGWRSDRRQERRGHAAFPLLVGGCAIATAALVDDPRARIAALTVAGFGMFAAMPVFWTMATSFLSQGAAAGGIALINAIGNLGGFLGPSVMGHTRDVTGDYSSGLLVLAGVSFAAMAVMLSIREHAARTRNASDVPGRSLSVRSATPRGRISDRIWAGASAQS